jgi:hypothetical protein
MTRKTSARSPARKAIPSLVGKLVAKTAVFSDLDNISLRAYIALDAFYRGKGSAGLLALIGRHLVVSENLCQAGYGADGLRTVREAHASLVRVDWDAQSGQEWRASGVDYEALRSAFVVYDEQLRIAPRNVVQHAQIQMVTMLTSRGKPAAQQQAA